MTTIVTRTTVGSNTGKGSPLTHTEVDTNFVNLNTAKLETAAIPLGTLGAPSISFLSYSTTGIYSPAGDELGVSMLGSDKIRIKSTGEIIINATASRTTLGVTPRLQIEGNASSSQCSVSLTGAGAGGTLFPRLYLNKARSSVNAVVLEDDILGLILFNGGDGSSLVNAGFIKAEVDGTPSAGIVPGRLVFATRDTAGGSGEHMIIKNNGNVSIDGTTFNVDAVNNRVGIGASAPEARLSVVVPADGYTSTANTLAVTGPNSTGFNVGTHYDGSGAGCDLVSRGYSSGLGDFRFISVNGSYASPATRMTIDGSGTITFSVYGAGTLSTSASGVISASDGRYKTKTRQLESGLEAIAALQPTYYRWNEGSPFESEHEELGFVAQEVAAVIPEASPGKDEEGKYRNYHDRAIIAMLVKGMQEQQSIITALTARVAALEAN